MLLLLMMIKHVHSPTKHCVQPGGAATARTRRRARYLGGARGGEEGRQEGRGHQQRPVLPPVRCAPPVANSPRAPLHARARARPPNTHDTHGRTCTNRNLVTNRRAQAQDTHGARARAYTDHASHTYYASFPFPAPLRLRVRAVVAPRQSPFPFSFTCLPFLTRRPLFPFASLRLPSLPSTAASASLFVRQPPFPTPAWQAPACVSAASCRTRRQPKSSSHARSCERGLSSWQLLSDRGRPSRPSQALDGSYLYGTSMCHVLEARRAETGPLALELVSAWE